MRTLRAKTSVYPQKDTQEVGAKLKKSWINVFSYVPIATERSMPNRSFPGKPGLKLQENCPL